MEKGSPTRRSGGGKAEKWRSRKMEPSSVAPGTTTGKTLGLRVILEAKATCGRDKENAQSASTPDGG